MTAVMTAAGRGGLAKAGGAGAGRARRRGLVGAVALVVALAAGLAAAVAGRDAGGLTRAQVAGYQADLLPIAQEWGRIEIQGMRPAIGDLVSGEGVPPETVAGEARAWSAGLEALDRKLAALEATAPGPLRDATARFRAAMVEYLAAARTFERAATATDGDRRLALVDEGIEAAQRGARAYNEASVLLQDARARVGLAPTPDFPRE